MNRFTATRKIAQYVEKETETVYIDSNLLDCSDDGLGQDNEDGGVPLIQFLTIWMSGNKDKEIKETLYFTLAPSITVVVRSFLIL